MQIIRSRLNLHSSQALYLLINETMVSNSSTVGELYETHKDKDEFLYIVYASQQVFG